MAFLKNAILPIILIVLTTACSVSYAPPQPPGTFYFPVSIAVHPNQNYAYVVSSNFDLGYSLGTLKVIDLVKLEAEIKADQQGIGCDGGPCYATYYADTILENSTLQIGNFGGQVTLNDGGTRLFVAQRQDNIVSWADISDGGMVLDCKGNTTDTSASSYVGSCHKSHFIQTGFNDPYAITPGPNPMYPAYGCMYITHLREGFVTCIASDAPSPTDLGVNFLADFSLGLPISGINDLAFNNSGRMFAANRITIGGSNFIGSGDPANVVLDPANVWFLDITAVAGYGQQKSLLISPDGKAIYLVTQAPDAVIKFSLTSGSGGVPVITTIDYAPAGIDPSRIFYLQVDQDTPLLYVPCVDGNYVHVFNGNTLERVAFLRFPFNAPYWMAFYNGTGGLRALVANFESSQISVISIDPLTLIHKFLANVGPPRPIASGGY